MVHFHFVILFTVPLLRVQSIVISLSVCLSVCLLVYLKNHHVQTSQNFLYTLPGTKVRSSAVTVEYAVYFWFFVDDIMFRHNGSDVAWRRQYRRQRCANASVKISNVFTRGRQGEIYFAEMVQSSFRKCMVCC